MRFHNHVILTAHVILFFEVINVTELTAPIPRGNLDYSDPNYGAINLLKLLKGQVFHWPKLLMSHDFLPDFQANLQAFIQGNGSDIEMSDNFKEDEVIKKACTNNNKAR
jgi:hypothetical protein